MSTPKITPPETAPPASTFAVREGVLAGRLGISRDVLRHLRQQHLQENVHFAYIAKRVQYTAEAVDLLRARLDLPPDELQKLIAAAHEKSAPNPADEEKPAPRETAALADTVTLKVWRNFSFKNSAGGKLRYNGIIEAYRPGTDPEQPGNLVRVCVGSGEHYVKHMEIPARQLADDLFQCARPDPRWRGYW